MLAVIHQQLGQPVDIEFVFGDHTAMGGACHGREHGGKAGISSKDLQDHQALVRAGYGAQAVGQLDRAGHTGAETDAVIGARNVVIHRLRDGNDLHAFLVHADAIA